MRTRLGHSGRAAHDPRDFSPLIPPTSRHSNLTPDEPIVSSAHICSYSDLEVKACSLDTLARDPEQPVAAECFLTFEAKALRECREALSGPGGVSDAYAYAEANPHPRLWRLVGEAALEKLELTVAEKALVQCEDYLGIQLVKKLKLLDAKKQAAEVAVHFGRFDDAEKLYRQMDRRDLALELRVRLGEWTKVVQLVQQGGGDDDLLTTAYNKIGDQFLERHEPKKAVAYYAQAKNSEALLECYEKLEDYAGLEKLVASLPDGHVLLAQIGRRFAAAGMAPEAVAAFTKGGDIKAAIDSCVEQNCWGAAVALAEESGNSEIGKRLGEYAAELIDGGRQLHAVELYMSAHQYADAAKLLSKLGKAEGEARLHPLRVKKLYVIAAMEVERMKRKMLGGPAPGATQTAAQTLQSLVTQDASTGRTRELESAWKSAEAHHFLLLSQRQLYDGRPDAAMRTALRLREYEPSVLGAEEVYSLIALTALHAKFYGQCSKAIMQLQALKDLPPKKKAEIDRLALAIFTKHPPNDPVVRKGSCHSCGSKVNDWEAHCGECGATFQACVLSGKAILDPANAQRCRACKHVYLEDEAKGARNCGLCHSPLPLASYGGLN